MCGLKWAISLVLFVSVLCFAQSKAGACSIIAPPEPHSETINQIRSKTHLDLIRGAGSIYIAKLVDTRRTADPVKSSPYWDVERYATDYRLEVIETLYGDPVNEIWYRSNALGDPDLGLPLVNAEGEVTLTKDRGYSADFDQEATERHSAFSFWQGWTRFIVAESISPGDCRNYIFFDPDVEYLVSIDADGKFTSAERVPTVDDPWLNAVRFAIDNPDTPHLGEITLQSTFREFEPMVEIATIRRCGRSPKVVRVDQVDGSKEIEEPKKNLRFRRNDDPYTEFPFTRQSCRRHARYLIVGYAQWFRVSPSGLVDLSELAFAKELTGPTKVSVETLLKWVDAEQE